MSFFQGTNQLTIRPRLIYPWMEPQDCLTNSQNLNTHFNGSTDHFCSNRTVTFSLFSTTTLVGNLVNLSLSSSILVRFIGFWSSTVTKAYQLLNLSNVEKTIKHFTQSKFRSRTPIEYIKALYFPGFTYHCISEHSLKSIM